MNVLAYFSIELRLAVPATSRELGLSKASPFVRDPRHFDHGELIFA